MSYSVHQELHQFVVATPELEIGFSRESGALTSLRRPDGTSVIGYGSDHASLDVRLSSGWMSQRFFPRYLSHQVSQEGRATLLTLRIGLGSLLVTEYYRITGTLIARSLALKNVGLDELPLQSVWLAFPGGRIGAPDACRLEAPGNGMLPRQPLSSVAHLRRDAPIDPRLVLLGRRAGLFESCPDRGPGLLALHSLSENENLLCWYFSDQQPALPAVEGDPGGTALTLGHEIMLAGWLGADEMFNAGVQYAMLVDGSWQTAMQAFQDTWPVVGLRSVADVPAWLREAVIYETHPALYGGFRGLAQALPRLQSLGINVLCLMPVWAYYNPAGRLWDGNWSASGSPYAVIDFERFEPTLGDEEDFRALVERAHRLGMRLVLDLVVQGCSIYSRYVHEQPDWFCRDARGRLVSSYGWKDTYSFDWANPAYQDFMLRWSLRLVREFNIDGYRVNAPQRKEPNWDRRLQRPASSTSFGILALLDRLQQGLRELHDEAVLISELDGPVYVRSSHASTDILAHLMLYEAGLGNISPGELSEWLEDACKALPAGATRICFTESHDTHATNPLADALHGSRLSRLLLAAVVACGYTPLLWYGQEQRQESFIRRLLTLRRQCRLLRDGETIYNATPCDVGRVFSVLRRLDGDWLICIFNLGPDKRLATLSLPVDTLLLDGEEYYLRELISGRIWEEDGRRNWYREDLLQLTITIEPYGFYFFALLPGSVPEPEAGLQRSSIHMRRPRQRRRGAERRLPRRRSGADLVDRSQS